MNKNTRNILIALFTILMVVSIPVAVLSVGDSDPRRLESINTVRNTFTQIDKLDSPNFVFSTTDNVHINELWYHEYDEYIRVILVFDSGKLDYRDFEKDTFYYTKHFNELRIVEK